ncbi:hypothetical protein AB6A40_007398 [Gnathostoma spinigerum]|uniref:CARD domain-containing protein n=1 Tax=Gnathostoma spinigerum TaxID=75299 RepID=A0ABD6ETR7_9BILA
MTSVKDQPRSLADIRLQQGNSLDRLRTRLADLNMRDLVPLLVARHVMQTHEMSKVYSQNSGEDQVDALISILKTKNHWLGPMTDALIRNGQAALAEELMSTCSISNIKSDTS